MTGLWISYQYLREYLTFREHTSILTSRVRGKITRCLLEDLSSVAHSKIDLRYCDNGIVAGISTGSTFYSCTSDFG